VNYFKRRPSRLSAFVFLPATNEREAGKAALINAHYYTH